MSTVPDLCLLLFLYFRRERFTSMSNQDWPVGYESSGFVTLNDSESKKRKIQSTLSQVLASTAKNVILFSVGLSLGYPTVVIPKVYNVPANATLRLTEEEVSWFGSINFATVLIGSIVSGSISQAFGRKRSMQGLTIPILISWIMFYYADSALVLCSAVALAGLAGGMLEAPVLTYISEISEPRLRGILTASAPLSSLFGSFTLFMFGSFIDWRTLSALCALVPILGFVVLFFVPESPHWLISKNRFEDTEKALRWLRGWTTKEHIQDEYDQLMKEIHPQQQHGLSSKKWNNLCSFNFKDCTKKTFTVPFLLILFTFSAGHFSGITSLTTYAVNIFNTFGAPIDANYVTIIFGLAQFSGTVTCMVLIHYTGKRPLVFSSVIGIIALFGGAGFYGHFYLGLEKLDNGAHVKEKFQEIPPSSWFSTVCFIGGSFFGYLGIRVLPWVLIGEIFPTDIRGFASGISSGLGYFLAFIANKTFFQLIKALTLPGVFIMYSGIGLVSLIVFYFWLPETEGWSLVEVQEHFAGKRNLITAGKKKTKGNDNIRGQDNPAADDYDETKL